MKYLLLLCCLILETELFSQSITSILHNKKSKVDTSITEILETATSYSETQNYQIKHRYIYLKGLEQFREDFDQQSNMVNSRLSYFYDEENRPATITFENWGKMGHFIRRDKYVYDETGLVKILIYNGESFSSYCLIVNNEKKLPVFLRNFNANETIIGSEKAVYNFDNNEVNISIYNDKGDLFYKDVYAINFLKNKHDIVLNEEGDEVAFKQKSSYGSKDFTQFEIEYTYDKKQNWVKKKVFILKGKKRIKYETVTRTISYAN